VLDEEDADASLRHDADEQVAEASGLVAVEPGRRLVEQEHVERPGEDAGQLDQPALTRGQGARLLVGEVLDAAQAQRRPCGRGGHGPLPGRRCQLAQHAGAGLARLAAEHGVLQDRQRVAQLDALERAPETLPAPRRGGEGGDVVAVQQHPTLEAPVQAAAGVEGGGLAGTVGADQPGDPAHGSVKAQIVDSDKAAEAHRETLHLDARRSRRGGDDWGRRRGRRRRGPTTPEPVEGGPHPRGQRRMTPLHGDSQGRHPEEGGEPVGRVLPAEIPGQDGGDGGHEGVPRLGQRGDGQHGQQGQRAERDEEGVAAHRKPPGHPEERAGHAGEVGRRAEDDHLGDVGRQPHGGDGGG
jgi:hypothetical protein